MSFPQRILARPAQSDGPAEIIARNVRRLRTHRGFSLDELAVRADIDAATLEELETGKIEPSLALAWRVSGALNVPFAALIAEHSPRGTVILRKDKAKSFASGNLGLASRALSPYDENQRVEFYELKLAPHHREESEPHVSGTVEFLFVAKGSLEIAVGREPPHLVNAGDSIVFPADLPHAYRNLTALPALLYLVMVYVDSPARKALD